VEAALGKLHLYEAGILAAPIDAEIDRAEKLVSEGQLDAAIPIFNAIGKSNSDYQVRAYAYYRSAESYLRKGDYWRAAGAAAQIWDSRAGISIQTCWQYRLLSDKMSYFLSESNDHKTPLRLVDFTVEKDITGNPEPRFFRALLNARYGDLIKAKADVDFILKSNPNNPSYRALAAYVSVLAGDDSQLWEFRGQEPKDPRALSLLGQAAFIAGDNKAAQNWWAQEAKIDTLEAKLAYWAGEMHLRYEQKRVATALLAESSAILPSSKEGLDAARLLAQTEVPPQ
jgi:tetratricopeptide (TPR) repeat protein